MTCTLENTRLMDWMAIASLLPPWPRPHGQVESHVKEVLNAIESLND